jgi:hypothetical protein
MPKNQTRLHEYLEWVRKIAGPIDDAIYYEKTFQVICRIDQEGST